MRKLYDENEFICGMAGYGKSTLLKIRLKTLPKLARVIVWDPNGQHKSLLNMGFEKWDGKVEGKKLHVATEGSEAEFDGIVNAALEAGNVNIAVEEAQEVLHNSCSRTVLRMLRTGRNRGVTYTAVTQIPSQCRDSVLSNAHYVSCFRLRRPEDTGYVAGWLGIPRDTVSSLSKYAFVHVSQDGQEQFSIEPVNALRNYRAEFPRNFER